MFPCSTEVSPKKKPDHSNQKVGTCRTNTRIVSPSSSFLHLLNGWFRKGFVLWNKLPLGAVSGRYSYQSSLLLQIYVGIALGPPKTGEKSECQLYMWFCPQYLEGTHSYEKESSATWPFVSIFHKGSEKIHLPCIRKVFLNQRHVKGHPRGTCCPFLSPFEKLCEMHSQDFVTACLSIHLTRKSFSLLDWTTLTIDHFFWHNRPMCDVSLLLGSICAANLHCAVQVEIFWRKKIVPHV